MKKIFTLLVLASVFLGISKIQAQQIPQFSQYMFNGLYINPAYAGYKEELYAHIMFRRQWLGVPGAPQTIMLGVDGDLGGGSNVGLIYANDRIGAGMTNSIMLSYAFRFQVSEQGRLAFGLSAGAVHYGLDKTKILDVDGVPDPTLSQAEDMWRPQVDVGAYFDLPNFYAGFSIMSLMSSELKEGKIQLVRTSPVSFLTLGGLVHFDENWAMAPSALFKTDFKSPLSVDITAMGVYAETIWLGLSYRTGLNFTFPKEASSESLRQTDALVIIAEVYLLPNLRLGAAYDFDLTHLSTDYNGGIEVSLGYYIQKTQKRYATPRYF